MADKYEQEKLPERSAALRMSTENYIDGTP